MPSHAARASARAAAVAPDGIAIHTFDLPPAPLCGIAEGRVPTGSFAVHTHLSLLQYTYVVSGAVTAVTAAVAQPDAVRLDLGTGDLLLTRPGESLQFINTSAVTARVLFICAPAYPSDDADTRLLASHSDLGRLPVTERLARLEAARAALLRAFDDQIASLRA